MVTDQPPLAMYAYGLAARGAVEAFPPEDRAWDFDQRWNYARLLFFGMNNDRDAVLGRARLVASGAAAIVVLGTGLFGLWIAGPVAGVLAGIFTALIPDVMAHGGVAYNDLPLAAAFLFAVWALDVAVRKPSPMSASIAALAVTATFGMKLSALALGPIFVILLGMEAWGRRGDAGWRKDVAVSLGVGAVATYVAMVLLYRGDPALTLLRFNFWRTVLHASGGHEAPAYLLGQTNANGWWYYFPVAFFFKTSVAFQAATGIAGCRSGLAMAQGWAFGRRGAGVARPIRGRRGARLRGLFDAVGLERGLPLRPPGGRAAVGRRCGGCRRPTSRLDPIRSPDDPDSGCAAGGVGADRVPAFPCILERVGWRARQRSSCPGGLQPRLGPRTARAPRLHGRRGGSERLALLLWECASGGVRNRIRCTAELFSLAHGPNIRCGGVPALHRSFGDESARDVFAGGGTRLQR